MFSFSRPSAFVQKKLLTQVLHVGFSYLYFPVTLGAQRVYQPFGICEGLIGRLCNIGITMKKRGFAAEFDPLVASLLHGTPFKDAWYLDPVTFDMVQNTPGGVEERRKVLKEARQSEFGFMEDSMLEEYWEHIHFTEDNKTIPVEAEKEKNKDEEGREEEEDKDKETTEEGEEENKEQEGKDMNKEKEKENGGLEWLKEVADSASAIRTSLQEFKAGCAKLEEALLQMASLPEKLLTADKDVRNGINFRKRKPSTDKSLEPVQKCSKKGL